MRRISNLFTPKRLIIRTQRPAALYLARNSIPRLQTPAIYILQAARFIRRRPKLQMLHTYPTTL